MLETAPVTRSSMDRKDSVFLSAPILLLTADPIPPNRVVVFSAVALMADSVFWYLKGIRLEDKRVDFRFPF